MKTTYETPFGTFDNYDDAHNRCMSADYDPALCIKINHPKTPSQAAREAVAAVFNWTGMTARELVECGRLMPAQAAQELSKIQQIPCENIHERVQWLRDFRAEVESNLSAEN